MADQFEVRSPQQMSDIRFLGGKKVIQTDNIMPVVHQSFAHVGTEETGTARNENAL
jgi:hypothetical protein